MVDTGVAVDTRQRTRADALVAGNRLYIVSHRFNRRPAHDGSVLFRYTYDARSRRYVPDRGFPVPVNRYGSETLVLAREGAEQVVGHLDPATPSVAQPHARCTPGLRRPRLGRAGADRRCPRPASHGDDVSSIVSLPGDRVAMMWSNQRLGAFYYVEPERGARPEPERIELVEGADDHLSLKSDSQGRIYAAVKTTSNRGGRSAHRAAGARTAQRRVARQPVRPDVRRPYAADRRRRRGGGSGARVRDGRRRRREAPLRRVYRKTTNLEATEPFPLGPGELVVVVPGGSVMDPTSTKQTVEGWWGLPVLASETRENRYAFGLQAPGGVLSAADGVTETTARSGGCSRDSAGRRVARVAASGRPRGRRSRCSDVRCAPCAAPALARVPRQLRVRSSSRLAMISCWISFEPSPIRSSGASR